MCTYKFMKEHFTSDRSDDNRIGHVKTFKVLPFRVSTLKLERSQGADLSY